MKIKFIGGIGGPGGLTGSCIWVKYPRTDTEFLVDCGMFQGPHSERKNLEKFPFDPRNIAFVLLTHAHVDHCGRIPLLYQRGFEGKIICTKATKDLAMLQFLDAVKNDRAYIQAGIKEADLERISFRCRDEDPDFQFGHLNSLYEDLWVCFLRSSHLLGAVAITVSWVDQYEKRQTICFSGDIGGQSDRKDGYQCLAKGNHYPHVNCKFLVVESTYGGRDASPDSRTFDNRIETLRGCIEKSKGPIVIPCFSIHRTQAVLLDLYHLFKEGTLEGTYEVILDSPLGRKATAVYGKELLRKKSKGGYAYFPNEFAREKLGLSSDEEVDSFIQMLFPSEKNPKDVECNDHSIRYRLKADEEKGLYGNPHRIIVSSSGMCSAGAVVKHLKKMLPRKDCSVILTGYQSQGTVGSQLIGLAENSGQIDKDEKLRFSDSGNNGKSLMTSDVKATIFDMGRFYSGHADQQELLEYVFDRWNDRKREFAVFLNHGDYRARRALKKEIECKHSGMEKALLKEVKIPKSSKEWFDLNHDGKKVPSMEDTLFDISERLSAMEKSLANITVRKTPAD